MNIQENIRRILREEVKSEEMKDENSLYSKLISSYSKFIRGEELHNFLKKIQTVVSFDDFTLRFSKGTDGANQFIIDIIDNTINEKVGRFVAFVYKDTTTNLYSLQILKVEIYPKYRGKGNTAQKDNGGTKVNQDLAKVDGKGTQLIQRYNNEYLTKVKNKSIVGNGKKK